MQNSNSGSSLGSILLGIGIGTIIGILYAPDKGTKTRQKLASKREDLMNAANDSYNQVADGARSVVNKVTDGAKSIYNEVADSAKTAYNDVERNGKTAYNEASHEVKKDINQVKDRVKEATDHR